MFKYYEFTKFARRPGKPENYIDYRQVICQIGLQMIHGDNQLNLFKLLNGLEEAILNKKNYIEPGYIEFYCIPNEEIFFLVDNTKGIFPLVFDNEPKTTTCTRKQALSQALQDLQANKDGIAEFLSQHSQWNDGLYKQLCDNK